MLDILQRLTTAIHNSPDSIQGQQRHQACVLPTLQEKLQSYLIEHLSEAQRDTLRDALSDIDSIDSNL